MAAVRETIAQIADTDASIVIQGETGVGKEVVARAIHEASDRAHRPFVKVLCAALPSQLLESELFGFEKGAFTDARAQKKGRFELAEGGTIFLDEIGEMSVDLQPKLLQVLQDREFHRLGGNSSIKVDVRVICATHRPLEEMVRDGRFRADLYYRLNVVQLKVPPLRARRDEIPTLFDGFVAHYAAKYRRPVPTIGPELRELLARSAFPGNVRELENLAKRLVVLGPPKAAVLEWRAPEMHAADDFARTAGEVPLLEVRRRVSREVERAVIDCALMATGWNRREAAKRLNLSYSTMLEKMKECGLRSDSAGSASTDDEETGEDFGAALPAAPQPGY
jgi:two-component system response regulator AtoC